jgi:putative ABC transport system permease protein
MVSLLDIKVWRDLVRIKGQAGAVALVMACGVAMLVMARSLINSLETTRLEYYQTHHFADVFAQLKRAPVQLRERLIEIPGVAAVEAGLVFQVTIYLEGVDEPASGQARSVPDMGEPGLNRLYLRKGRWLSASGRHEVLVGEAFAEANQLEPGDEITILLNGKRQALKIVGIVLSPEFIFESRPGTALPDNRTYGIFWMRYTELASAFDMDGAFNFVALALSPGSNERPVIAEVDRLLAVYGGRGAFGRGDHPSHVRVSDEIRVLTALSIGFPAVFLTVSALMSHAVLLRLVNLQREQIAILKAFGFGDIEIAWHYFKFALVITVAGIAVGTVGGMILGRWLVVLYHFFFRFPSLEFELDVGALVLAVIVSAGAAVAGVFGAVRRAACLPPAEAMRPEPPTEYRPALVERTGIGRWLSHTFRIAVRNIERRPMQAVFTVAGLALATGILIIPSCFRDGVDHVMEFQWDVVQRQDLSVGLVEPGDKRVCDVFAQLPGVLHVEPFRAAFVRLRNGNRHRQLAIRGIPAGTLHDRVIDARYRQIVLPKGGLVFSAKLADVLGARVGDQIMVESLEGKRTVAFVPLVALAEDFSGVAAYMDMESLNRILLEGDIVSGATFSIDKAHWSEFLGSLKQVPRVSWVAIKNSLRESFRRTTARSIDLIQRIYMTFAIVVAFGVVYNNARISLAERARELATLRVVGFSRGEVGSILLTELVLLALPSVPLGLLLGTLFSSVIIGMVNTETVRLPLILTSHNYAFAALVVAAGSLVSAMVVLQKLKHLDLIAVLRAPE